MGFLFASGAGTKSAVNKNKVSEDLVRQLGCRACPLNKAEHIISPKMPPSGSNEPLIYVMAEGPGQIEDEQNKQLVGPSGDLLWPLFPARLRSKIRRNNIVNCRTSETNRNPERIEIEACRPRTETDIEQTKPKAIIGLGGVPLQWANTPSTAIQMWSGRRFPIKIGNHTCWYYPVYHPAFILHLKKENIRDDKLSWRDYEFAFQFHVKKAIREIEEGLPIPKVHTSAEARSNITCITGRSGKDLKYVLDFLEYAGTCDLNGVDLETQNRRPYYKDSVILTKSVSTLEETIAFAWEHPEAGWSSSDLELLRDAWIKYLKSNAKKISHGLSFEMEWTVFFYGRELARQVPWEDTLTQAFVLDERIGDSKPGALSLEFISFQHFGINIKSLTKGLNKSNMKAEPLASILPYNGIDSKYHLLNYIIQEKRIKDEGLVEVYQEKVRQVPTVVLTQLKGVPIDRNINQELAKEYIAKIEAIQQKIEELPEAKRFRQLTGQKFNPGSPQDVIVILRDILKTRNGQEGKGWSTDKTVMNKIANPIGRLVLDYREIVKLKGTYVDPMSPGSATLFEGDLLHQQLGTCFTETGRLESEDPNMQNWPVRTKEGKRVRRQVKAAVIAKFDYGQIDARIIACGSRDRKYCRALWDDLDIHMEWAEKLAAYHPPWVGGKEYIKDLPALKKFRGEKVKNAWVFALFYTASLRTTAGRFGVSEDFLKPMYKEFWEDFVGVKEWQKELEKDFLENGEVQMLGGLKRRAPLGLGMIVNCVDTETECLTEKGWKKVEDLKIGTKIYTKNPISGDIELQECFGVTKSRYKGKVCVLNGSLSAVTTPNHRWLVTTYKGRPKQLKVEFITSEEFTEWGGSGQRIHLTGNPILQQGGIWTDDEVRLAGWLLTDGYINITPKTYGSQFLIGITQSSRGNPEKVKSIDGLFERLFGNGDYALEENVEKRKWLFYRRYEKESNGGIEWRVYNKLTEKLCKALPEKILNERFLQDLSSNQLQILFNTMLLGDGCWSKTYNRYGRFVQGTKKEIDMFSMLCVLIGQSHNIFYRDMDKYYNPATVYESIDNKPRPYCKGCWMIQLKQRKFAHPNNQLSWKDFDGEVWCPQVPNQTFIARREGTVYVTGNTPVQGATNRIVMDAKNRLSEREEWPLQPIMQIHDDLSFAFESEKQFEESVDIILDTMLDGSAFPWFCVPLSIEVEIGSNWGETEPVGTFYSHKRLGWPNRAKEFR